MSLHIPYFNRRKVRQKHLTWPKEWGRLRERCLALESDFCTEGEVTETQYGDLIFQDNGAPVLAVAHLDTVQQTRHFGHYAGKPDKLFCGQLDDRLGVYIILDLLHTLNCPCDVLLTTGEEMAQSTASFFDTAKEYNWMVEFDRTGTDVVTYHYNSDDWENALEEKNELGFGSFSDISSLTHLGISGVNWGIGYHDYHSREAYAVMTEVAAAIHRFTQFYGKYVNVRFPHCKADEKPYAFYGGGFLYDDNSWQDWELGPDGRTWVKNDKRWEMEWQKVLALEDKMEFDRQWEQYRQNGYET